MDRLDASRSGTAYGAWQQAGAQDAGGASTGGASVPASALQAPMELTSRAAAGRVAGMAPRQALPAPGAGRQQAEPAVASVPMITVATMNGPIQLPRWSWGPLPHTLGPERKAIMEAVALGIDQGHALLRSSCREPDGVLRMQFGISPPDYRHEVLSHALPLQEEESSHLYEAIVHVHNGRALKVFVEPSFDAPFEVNWGAHAGAVHQSPSGYASGVAAGSSSLHPGESVGSAGPSTWHLQRAASTDSSSSEVSSASDDLLEARQRRTGLMAVGVQADAIEDAAASTAGFAVFRERRALQLHPRNSEETYDFSVTYQVGTSAGLHPQAHECLRRHFPDDAALLTHLKRLLAADFSNLGAEVTYSAEYLQAHKAAFQGMDLRDPRRRALENWAEPNNEYTTLLRESLLHYSKTGEIEPFENEDPLREGEGIDPLEEELNLTQGLLALPELAQAIPTLRVATASPEHYSKADEQGRFAIAGHIRPGDYVSNYPIAMSTTSGTNLGQFSTLDAMEQEIRVYQVFGRSGRPLLTINPVDDLEKELLYHSRSTFQLVAGAYAAPSDELVCPRVVGLFCAVDGQDPKTCKNIHTGLLPQHFLRDL